MNIAKKYNVKLFPLTDIFIGSGKDIEAYEYTIKDKYMYRIDMSEIIDNMSDFDKKEFYNILKNGKLIKIRTWIYENYKEEWGYTYKEKVSDEFSEYYKSKIKGVGVKNENSELNIQEFIGERKNKYIPGSSIKGALRTAFIYSYFLDNEDRYKIKKIKNEAQIMEAEILSAEKEDKNKNTTGLEPKKDPFKTVKVSDTEKINLEDFTVNKLKIKEGTLICEALKGIYTEDTNDFFLNEKKGINFNIVSTEYILKNNNKMNYKNKLGIKELINSLDDKMENILDFEIKKERKNEKYKIKEFYEKLKEKIEKIKNQDSNISLIRIGKYTGFNDKTINLVSTSPTKQSRDVLDGNEYPMGWALIKVEEVKV